MVIATVGLSVEGIQRWQKLNCQVELRGVLMRERFEQHRAGKEEAEARGRGLI